MALLTTSQQPFVDPTWPSWNIRNDVKISTLTQIIPHHDKFKHSTHFNKRCSNINLKYNSLLYYLFSYRIWRVHSKQLTSSLTTTRLSAKQHLTSNDSFLFQQTTPCSKTNFLIRSNNWNWLKIRKKWNLLKD